MVGDQANHALPSSLFKIHSLCRSCKSRFASHIHSLPNPANHALHHFCTFTVCLSFSCKSRFAMLLLSITFHNLSFLQITFCCANHALCTFIVCRYHFVQITPTRQCLSHANDRITMFCFEFECHFLNFSEMHARITQIRKNETYGFISFTVTRKSYFRSMSLSLH